MRCDEIQERFVDLLYQERGTAVATPELEEHLRTCSDCQKELAGLKDLQSTLKIWQDEAPLRPISLPRTERVRIPPRTVFWRVARYAAVAALVTLALLGASNARVTWDRNGFSFRSSLWTSAAPASEYYTKEEMKTILERVMEVTQENNFQLIQRMMDTIDQERATEYRMITRQIKESRNRN